MSIDSKFVELTADVVKRKQFYLYMLAKPIFSWLRHHQGTSPEREERPQRLHIAHTSFKQHIRRLYVGRVI